MTDIDLTEATEKVARLMYPGVFTRNAPNVQRECIEDARVLMTAAAPFIAAQVRAQIAADIEAAQEYDEDFGYVKSTRQVSAQAAHIARGDAS